MAPDEEVIMGALKTSRNDILIEFEDGPAFGGKILSDAQIWLRHPSRQSFHTESSTRVNLILSSLSPSPIAAASLATGSAELPDLPWHERMK